MMNRHGSDRAIDSRVQYWQQAMSTTLFGRVLEEFAKQMDNLNKLTLSCAQQSVQIKPVPREATALSHQHTVVDGHGRRVADLGVGGVLLRRGAGGDSPGVVPAHGLLHRVLPGHAAPAQPRHRPVDGAVAHGGDRPAPGRAATPRHPGDRHLSHGAPLPDQHQRPQDAVARARGLRRVQVQDHRPLQPGLLALLGAAERLDAEQALSAVRRHGAGDEGRPLPHGPHLLLAQPESLHDRAGAQQPPQHGRHPRRPQPAQPAGAAADRRPGDLQGLRPPGRARGAAACGRPGRVARQESDVVTLGHRGRGTQQLFYR